MKPINYDFSGVLKETIGADNGLSMESIVSEAKRSAEGGIDYPFMHVVDETATVEQMQKAAEHVRSKFNNIVVLGIGGSALGLRCAAQALLPPHYNLLDSKARGGRPRLFVCDNIDPDFFGALCHMLDWKETCVNVISKSGKTVETLSQLFIIKELLAKKLGEHKWQEHVFVTTDPSNGPLREMAAAEKLTSFEVPPAIGGRFSVLTPVGLFPAACVGIDIARLLRGAKGMVETCKDVSPDKNPAALNAAIHYLMDKNYRRRISVLMPYADSLSLFSDWYVQLWAESLGKNGQGPTPVKALGATDQHSQIQLYMEGPSDKVITIMGVEKFRNEIQIPATDKTEFNYFCGKNLGDVLKAEEAATAGALLATKKPVVRITLPEITPEAIGELFMMYELSTALSGKLYGIDPFDQPGVELGKKLTKELLSK